jgi:serine/threonine protein kinase/tetratricopeptide (TPR) repeat protein
LNTEQWRQIESIFAEAVEVAPSDRAAFLDRACGGDLDLRREVESLLACDRPGEPLAGIAANIEDTEMAGRRIGPYRLIRLIGQGGMGAVYLGVRDDDQYQKQVAVKLLKRGMDTDETLSLFRQERQILANLEHPFIAHLMDGGATSDGLPYFVMELIDGVPITAYCDDHKLAIPERLKLFRLVCEAVQYAHQNLVIHRDLKPSNILTTREGIPKLLDFGIAKILDPGRSRGDSATVTRGRSRMLTPDYASPEQVKGLPMSTASDVYSLGAVLYELISGQKGHQFPSSSLPDVERTICEVEPEKPSSVTSGSRRKELAGDLDCIVLAAMRKDPQRRYATVADLSEDIRRHLEGLPILIEQERWSYRAAKFVRRNKFAAGTVALIAASLIGGIITTSIQARRAERRFNEVRGLANSLLFTVHDQIEALPGSTRVREAMIRTVLKYLNNLAGDAGNDPTLQWELATAYQKVGDVQGYGVRPNLGQRAEAIESHRKALQIAEQLAARNYDPKVQRLLAVSHHRTGFLIEGDQQHVAGGIEHYQRALELLEKLNQEAPGNPEDSPLLVMLHGHMGDAELLRGRENAAAASWQRALEVAQLWASKHPTDASRNALGVCHRRVARGAQLNGALDQALEQARKALAIHQDLAAAQPANTARQRELLNSYERIAFIAGDPDALNLGDLKTAHTFNQKVFEIARSLVEVDRNNRMAASDFAIARRSQCLFSPDNDPRTVVQACRDAIQAGIAKSFVETLPAAAPRLAPALLRTGRRDESVETMNTAVNRLIETSERWPWRADLGRQLIRVRRAYGDLLLAMKRGPEAFHQYELGVKTGEEMLRINPRDLVLRRDMGDMYQAVGRYYEAFDKKQAVDWYNKDLRIWSDWHRFAESSSLDKRRRDAAIQDIARCTASH